MTRTSRAVRLAATPRLPRRSFLQAAGLAALASGLRVRPAVGATAVPAGALVMDAMGELRMEYEASLIRDMLGSGLRSITIT
ncbi:MAG: hypothetical protein ACREMG_10260, partial [Gemmatimonadales bacterium]